MTNIIYDVTNFAALRALTGTNLSGKKHVAYKATTTDGLGGIFLWDGSDLSDEVAADTEELNYVVPTVLNANGSQGAFCRLKPQKPNEQWNLQDFAGASWDTKFSNALANIDSGTRLIITPDTGTPLVFEGAHTLNVTDGRWVEIVGYRTQITPTGAIDWLTITADAAAQGNPRTLVRGLVAEPAVEFQGTFLTISDTGNTQVEYCFIDKFDVGIHLYNDDSYTEYTTIRGCNIRGNRIGIWGSSAGTEFSQRATKILDTLISAKITGGTADTTWNICIQLDDVSWYHATLLGVALGLKRNYACGLKMTGGRLTGAFGFLEGEGNKTTYTPVRGLWLQDGVFKQTGAKGANVQFSMVSIDDGGDPEDEEDFGSDLIYDERTNITGQGSISGIKFRGPGWGVSPRLNANTFYNILNNADQHSTASDLDIGLRGLAFVDGAEAFYEQVSWDKDTQVYQDWFERYSVAEKSLLTSAYDADVPLALECVPFNKSTLLVEALSEDSGTYYIDIGEANCTVVHVSATGTLHQIRGGREGQIIVLFSTNTSGLTLVHHTGAATDNVFQLSNQLDWVAPHTRSAIALCYVYHSPVGWHWEQIGGARPKHTVSRWVPAGDMYPSTTGGCSTLQSVEIGTNKVDVRCLDFDSASDESAQFCLAMPADYDGGTITFQAIFFGSTADAGDVQFELQGRVIGTSGGIDQAFGTAVAVTKSKASSADKILISDMSTAITLAGSAPAAGEWAQFKLTRDVSDDDLAADARLLGVNLFYTAKK